MTDHLTPEDLAAMEERANTAWPGPWHIGHIDENHDYAEIDSNACDHTRHIAEVYHREDQAFVAAARSDVPRLIAGYRAMEKALREAYAKIEYLTEAVDRAEPAYIEAIKRAEKAEAELQEIKAERLRPGHACDFSADLKVVTRERDTLRRENEALLERIITATEMLKKMEHSSCGACRHDAEVILRKLRDSK